MVGDPGIGCTGGKTHASNNLGKTPMPLVGRNGNRRFIMFANPGNVTVYVALAFDVDSKPLELSVPFGLGGTLPVFAGVALVVNGECQREWIGIAASGSNNPFTVFESNID